VKKNTNPLAYIALAFFITLTPGLHNTTLAQNSSDVRPGNDDGMDEIRQDLALHSFVRGATDECEENYPRALEAYRKALTFDENPAIHLAIARVAREMHDQVTAVDHTIRALELQPDDASALRKLGEVYSAREQVDSATYILENLLRIEGGSEQLLQALGGLYAQQRMFDRAAAIYDTLRHLYPEETMYALMCAEMELNRGAWPTASDILYPLSSDSAIGHEDRVRIGKLYFQKALQDHQDLERAINVFDALTRDFPEDWRPLWFRGAVLFNSGSIGDAMGDFEKVMQLSPGNTEAGMILARAYLTQERAADAVRVLQQLVDRRAASTETWTMLSFAWSKLGKNDRALESLEQARRRDPANLDVLSTLAMTYIGLQKYDSADAVVETVIDAYEENAREKDDRYYLLLNNYAYSLAERDVDLDRALEISEEAVRFSPKNSAYCDTRGWISFRMEDYDEALDWLLQALQLRESTGSPSAQLHEHLGEVYRAMDRPAEARAHWNEALRQEPGNPALQEKLHSLDAQGE